MSVALRRLAFVTLVSLVAGCGADASTAPDASLLPGPVPEAVLARLDSVPGVTPGTPEFDPGALVARTASELVRDSRGDGVRPARLDGFGPGGSGVVVSSELRAPPPAIGGGTARPPSTTVMALLWNDAGEIAIVAPGAVLLVATDGTLLGSSAATQATITRRAVRGPCAGFTPSAVVPTCELGSYAVSVRTGTFRTGGGTADGRRTVQRALRIDGTLMGVSRVVDATRLVPHARP